MSRARAARCIRVNRHTLEARDIQPKTDTQGEAALQLEHAARGQPRRRGHDLYRRPVPVPQPRPRPELGQDLPGSDDQRSRRSRSRKRAAASPSTTPPPRPTPRSTRSASRPSRPGMIWVGTDDGNLQLTRDGGKSWTNLTKQRRHAAGLVGVLDRGQPHRSGGRLCRLRPAHLRRLRPLHLPHRRLRPNLEADRRPAQRHARLCPRDQGRSRTSPACSTRAPSSACGSRPTAARAGRSSRAATCPT